MLNMMERQAERRLPEFERRVHIFDDDGDMVDFDRGHGKPLILNRNDAKITKKKD
jgi:hypothetical protein